MIESEKPLEKLNWFELENASVLENIFDFVKVFDIENIFYLIYILTTNKVKFYFPVEELYQVVLDPEISLDMKSKILTSINCTNVYCK